jgi:hypothetical protein
MLLSGEAVRESNDDDAAWDSIKDIKSIHSQ